MLTFDLSGQNAGDIVLASPAIQALRHAGHDVNVLVAQHVLAPVKDLVQVERRLPGKRGVTLLPMYKKGMHRTDEWMGRLAVMGINAEPRKLPQVKGDSNLVLLQPWCLMPSKRFTIDYWQAAAKLATDAGKKVIVGGPVSYRHEADRICEGIEGATNLCGTDSGKWVDTVRGAGMVVSVDSGAAHVADAMGKPTVVLFRSTDPRKWSPFWDRSGVLSKPNVEEFLKVLDYKLES